MLVLVCQVCRLLAPVLHTDQPGQNSESQDWSHVLYNMVCWQIMAWGVTVRTGLRVGQAASTACAVEWRVAKQGGAESGLPGVGEEVEAGAKELR